jgi:hypothetical protein
MATCDEFEPLNRIGEKEGSLTLGEEEPMDAGDC